MSIKLASAILRSAWLISPTVAQSHLSILDGILKGESKLEPATDEEKKAFEPFTAGILGGKVYPSPEAIVVGAGGTGSGVATKPKMVRVIPVVGVMLKYSEECGPIGTTDIAKRVEAANNDPNVDAIVLKIDSPGGMVDGTQTLADAIKKAQKPVVAFIDDGMACSAAYWVASAADEIFASQATDCIGSIGVYVTLADFKKYYEAKGLPIHEIYADNSGEKNKSYKDALAGDYSKIKKDMLNPIAEKFISAVKANRNGKLNMSEADPFKGDTYMAERALQIGLIDNISSFEAAILRAAELSDNAQTNQPATPNSTENTMKINLLSSQVLLAAILGVSFAEGETEKEIQLSSENLAAIEAALKKSADDLSAANVAKENAEAEVTRLGKQAGQMTQDPPAPQVEGPKGSAIELSETDAALAKLKAEMGL